MLDEKWGLGVNDRGHGHYSYAVVVEDLRDPGTAFEHHGPEVVTETGTDRKLAVHIVETHNKSLEGPPPCGTPGCDKPSKFVPPPTGFCADCWKDGL